MINSFDELKYLILLKMQW